MESFGKEAAVAKPAQRIAWFYVPIGVVRRGFFPGEASAGIPKFTGSRKEMAEGVRQIPVGVSPLELTPTMKPLEKMREKVRVMVRLHKPDRVPIIDSLLEKYKGAEDEIYAQLREKYAA